MKSSRIYLGAAVLFLRTAACLVPPESLPFIPVCWLKKWFDVPCPACGMTHALCAIGHGRLRDAWDFQPFSFLVCALGLVFVVESLWKGRFSSSFLGGRWALWLVAGLFMGWVLRWV
jgi:hypothetical protein